MATFAMQLHKSQQPLPIRGDAHVIVALKATETTP
jgi:hypothetical protein